MNDFEKNVQSKRNDAVDSAVGFVVSFGFFVLFVRDGNSHPSYRLLAAFRAAVNRQSFLLLAPWFLLYHMEGRRKTFRRLF